MLLHKRLASKASCLFGLPPLPRLVLGVKSYATTLCLQARVMISHSTVTGTADVDVSMTTHDSRMATVHLAIESIARGSVRPRRFILWVSEKDYGAMSPELLRQVRRGLEVRIVENYGPHTKYYPYVLHCRAGVDLVTADDDVLYPRWWLRTLLLARGDSPDMVLCHRAHSMLNDDKGALLPYESWSPCRSTDPDQLVFVTGVSGVLYPPLAQKVLAETGESFLSICRGADDVWINLILEKSGIQRKQISSTPRLFSIVRAAQANALWRVNNGESHNDGYITRVHEYLN